MRLLVSNDIRVINPTQEIKDYARTQLVLANPEYVKKESMGFWVGDTEKEISLYIEDGSDLILPFGCLDKVWELGHKTPNFEFKTDFSPVQPLNILGGINLYPYQQRALEALIRGKNGILEAPCGSGKTQIGLALIKELGGRALWLTHTQKLLAQSKERCERYYKGDFGTITEGKIKLGKDITFATVQTMSNIDPRIYKEAFNTVVVDECHRASGTPTNLHMFYKVVSNCKARHKYGMSATLTRGDGLIKSVYAILGERLHTITEEEIGDKIIKAKHQIVEVPIKYKPVDYCLYDGTLDYGKMLNLLCEDKYRSMLIASKVIEARMQGRKKQLILTARVAHASALQQLIPNSSLVVGSVPEKQRDYSASVLIATYALAKEGLDIPELDTLHLATPTKDKSTVIQSVGRIERNIEGKQEPICFDYVDKYIPYCVGAYTKRKNYLRARA